MKTLLIWYYQLKYKYYQRKARELADTADLYFLESHAACDKIEKLRSKILDLGGNL